MIKISDRNNSDRAAVVDADSIAPVIGRWLADDAGLFTVHRSPNITALCRALRRSDWTAVHAIADHLSISLEVLA